MSDHLDPNLTAAQIITRVIFSLAVTAATGFGVYVAIGWLAKLR